MEIVIQDGHEGQARRLWPTSRETARKRSPGSNRLGPDRMATDTENTMSIGAQNERGGPAPRMTDFLLDGPNLVTLVGLLAGFAALVQTIRGELAIGLAFALLAIIIDNVDGALARRDPGRSAIMRSFGAHLDCFADFVSKGLFPPLLLLAVAGDGAQVLAVGALHVVAVALRYSWELGAEGPARGLSPDYAIVVFAALHLCRDALGEAQGAALATAMLLLAALAIAPLRVPKLAGWGLRAFMALLCAMLIALVAFG